MTLDFVCIPCTTNLDNDNYPETHVKISRAGIRSEKLIMSGKKSMCLWSCLHLAVYKGVRSFRMSTGSASASIEEFIEVNVMVVVDGAPFWLWLWLIFPFFLVDSKCRTVSTHRRLVLVHTTRLLLTQSCLIDRLVDLQKLRDYARHGVQPTVRGEVWLYLLGVLSADKSKYCTVSSFFLLIRVRDFWSDWTVYQAKRWHQYEAHIWSTTVLISTIPI